MVRKKTNTRKRSGGRKKSVTSIKWDEGSRRKASKDAGGWHGYQERTAYSTASGAKGRAPKQEGVVIAKETDYIYYWYLDADKVPLQFEIVSIWKDDRWQGISHSPDRILIGLVRRIHGFFPTDYFTNITNIDDSRLREYYDNIDHWDGSPPDTAILQSMNRNLSRATHNRASAVYAGSNDIADVYHINYFGRADPKTGGSGPRDQLRRTRIEVTGAVAHVPFIFQECIGDISGEGDYTSHLVVFKEDVKFDT